MSDKRKHGFMRIAYLTPVRPTPAHADTLLPGQMTDALAKRGHKVLVIAASEGEFTHEIYRNRISIVQLRSFKCPFFVGHQPVLLPFPKILQSLYRFRPDIIYMDAACSMNWIGYVYSLFSHIPTRSTPQRQKISERN
jgi:hypothetical protein